MNLRSIARKAGPFIPLRVRRALLFYRSHGRFPPRVPKSFNEKVNWRITFDRRPELLVGGDKLKMKAYAKSVDSSVAVAEPLWWGTDVASVMNRNFGDKWVLKPISGSGKFLIGSGTLAESGVSAELVEKWHHDDIVDIAGEWVYSAGQPGWLVEEFIRTDSGEPPVEMKFFVFDGKVRAILMDHVIGGETRRRYYTADWEPLDVRRGEKVLDRVRPAPANLSRMVESAILLAGSFDFIRVDFFDAGSKIWFGELSPYPASGLTAFSDPEFDYWLGLPWALPSVI